VSDDGVYLVGEDLVGENGSVVLKLGRLDYGSDLFSAGYIAGLQGEQIRRQRTKEHVP
jgi:hypothetical protein